MFTKNSIDPKARIKFTAYIGQDQTWWSYYVHYKSAIDVLVKSIEDGTPVNTVSLPLLFLVRHCLEIGFKANILKLETVSDAQLKMVDKYANTHSLSTLYGIFQTHLKAIQKSIITDIKTNQTIDVYLVEIERLKDIFHNLDYGSYHFRYPVNNQGKQNFDWNEQINIADIIELFYRLQPFILFTDSVLAEYGAFYNDQDIHT